MGAETEGIRPTSSREFPAWVGAGNVVDRARTGFDVRSTVGIAAVDLGAENVTAYPLRRLLTAFTSRQE